MIEAHGNVSINSGHYCLTFSEKIYHTSRNPSKIDGTCALHNLFITKKWRPCQACSLVNNKNYNENMEI